MNKISNFLRRAQTKEESKLAVIYDDWHKAFPNQSKYLALSGSVVLRIMNVISRPVGDIDIMVNEKAVDLILTLENMVKMFSDFDNSRDFDTSGSYDAHKDIDGVLKHIPIVVGTSKICVFVVKDEFFNNNTIVVLEPYGGTFGHDEAIL